MDESIFWKTVGERIKDRREKFQVTQEALAKHLNVTRTAIGKIEKGERKVSTLELTKISQRLFHPVWEFIPQ
jgi:transcriptional regulator with XRE-family HTH domain